MANTITKETTERLIENEKNRTPVSNTTTVERRFAQDQYGTLTVTTITRVETKDGEIELPWKSRVIEFDADLDGDEMKKDPELALHVEFARAMSTPHPQAEVRARQREIDAANELMERTTREYAG